MRLKNLPAVDPLQVQTIAYDFGNFLPLGVRLVNVPTVVVTVHTGVDAAPGSRISFGPTISTCPVADGGTGVVNTSIVFQVSNCLSGTTYAIEATCDRSDGSDVVSAWARLPCVGST